MDQQKILNALNMGSMWTAKWLADLADAHIGTDTEHLVRRAEKHLAAIQAARAEMGGASGEVRPERVMVPRLAMKVAIANAIWKIDGDNFTGARVSMIEAQDILTEASDEAVT